MKDRNDVSVTSMKKEKEKKKGKGGNIKKEMK